MSTSDKSPRTPRRLAPFIVAALAILLLQIVVAYLVMSSKQAEDVGYLIGGRYPIGGDFVLYYSASLKALAGDPAAVYDVASLHQVEQQVLGSDKVTPWQWYYPPPFLFAVLPLGLLPFLGALVLWSGLGLAAYLAVTYRIAPHRLTVLLCLLFPAAGDNLFIGQNGFITTALIGAGLLLVDRRPLLAGLCFGLLSYKPHLGLLIPIALLAGGHWRTFAAAALTVIGLALVSAAAFGLDPWQGFFGGLARARESVETGHSPWYAEPSVFVSGLMLGAGVTASWVAQAIAMLGAAGVVAWFWRRRAPLPLRASALILALPLSTPYAQFYDFTMVALAIAWLAWDGMARGWLRGERPALALLWAMPIFGQLLAVEANVHVWPLVLVASLAMVARRFGHETLAR